MKPALVLFAIVISLAASGCTSQQAYSTGQGWQRNQCNKIPDNSERERCMGSASMSYDTYKREAESSRKQ